MGQLEHRIGEVERRLSESDSAAELRDEIRRVSESASSERQSLSEALLARVEEITATTPRAEEMESLRAQLDEVAARPAVDDTLRDRVGRLSERMDRLGEVEATVSHVRTALDNHENVRVNDALANGARLVSLETAIETLEGAENRIREAVAAQIDGRALELTERLQAAESRIAGMDELEAALSTLAGQVERAPSTDDMENVATTLRYEIEALVARPTIEDPSARLDELSSRIGAVAGEAHDRTRGIVESLDARLEELETGLWRRSDELGHRMDVLLEREEAEARFLTRDDASASASEQAERIRRELAALRESQEGRARSLEAKHGAVEQAHALARQELAERIDGVAADAETARGQLRTELGVELRAELGARLDDRAGMLDARIDEHWGETSALRSEIEGLRAAVAARADADARLEQLLDKRLEGLSAHVASEVGRVRLDVDTTVTMALDTVRGEATALGARLDHVVGLRSADVEAARAAGAHLEGRLDALAALRADDAEAAQIAADELAERLSALALSLHAEAAGARASAETVAAQVADLHGLRSEDRAATELAGAELAARLDDHAVRSAAAAFEVEQALRDELGGVAARLEERDAQGIEAREELRAELERVGLSVGWRLEQIEVSLAADESAALKVSVAELQHRLDAHAAIGDEQVRTTERALRKGLAALGERLVDTEEAYLEAGNTLRRSIERLGAAVVEADARMADQIPVSTAEGCVAFAPTPDGYRLVELPGPAPELGSTLELEESEGLLVVTRYGRSPLPLDSRPCAYLDRA